MYYPHLVTKDASSSYTNKNGEIFISMTFTMTDLIPYLIKAIQELNTIVQEQYTNIQQHISMITSLELRLNTLEQRLAAANIA